MSTNKKGLLMLSMAFLLSGIIGCGNNNQLSAKSSSNDDKKSSQEIIDDEDVIKNKTEELSVSGGKIIGYYSDDNALKIYKGIPYAQAERFKRPEEITWQETKECINWGASCLQTKEKPYGCYTAEFMGSSTIYSEDCLNLNIWTKNDDIKNKPVLVYIHGGAYVAGNGSCKVYDGSGMARKDVVFVNINYRLGLFGFYANEDLIKEDAGAAGNYGILDQIQALKWVQQNIDKFNGDKNNVTIVGQSAGGGSVNCLVQSPLSKGLFKRACALSANSVCFEQFSCIKQDEKVAQFASVIKARGIEDRNLVQMRALSDEEFFKAYSKIWDINVAPIKPSIDGATIVGKFSDVLSKGDAIDVDYFIGSTTDDIGDKISGIEATEYLPGETCVAAYSHYLGNYQGKVYTYLFSHQMPGTGKSFGVFHSSDVPYFFNVFSKRRAELWTEEDYKVGDQMSSYLANFVKTGNPNGEGLTNWVANNPTKGNIDYSYMDLDVTCQMKSLKEESKAVVTTHYQELINKMESNNA